MEKRLPTEFEMEFFLQNNKKREFFLKMVAIKLFIFIMKKIKFLTITAMETFGHGQVAIIFLMKVTNRLEEI